LIKHNEPESGFSSTDFCNIIVKLVDFAMKDKTSVYITPGEMYDTIVMYLALTENIDKTIQFVGVYKYPKGDEMVRVIRFLHDIFKKIFFSAIDRGQLSFTVNFWLPAENLERINQICHEAIRYEPRLRNNVDKLLAAVEKGSNCKI